MIGLVDITPLHWAGFIVFIIFCLALDLGFLNRKGSVITFKKALLWTSGWFSLSMLFALVLLIFRTRQEALDYVTGYIVELSLSMDNVFVIACIFSYFRVPEQYQRRVLIWGILGALFMRGVMIGLGAALIQQFIWILYLLGAFLVFTGIKMLFSEEDGVEPEKNPFIKYVRKLFPISNTFERDQFFTQIDGRMALTPLALVLIMVETTDLVFAVDSIPAIFGITQDPFIVFTSNIFAILGLRSLYFVLAGAINYFHYLKYGLSIVLIFIGGKMVAGYFHLHIPTWLALSIVIGILGSSVCFSIIRTRQNPPTDLSHY